MSSNLNIGLHEGLESSFYLSTMLHINYVKNTISANGFQWRKRYFCLGEVAFASQYSNSFNEFINLLVNIVKNPSKI